MKPDWDKLMKSFAKSKRAAHGLVADVDCTEAGKPLCEKNGVKGFPTLKWGDPNALQVYEGARDYDSLKKFTLENIKPICGVKNLDLCSAEKKALIEGFMAMAPEELDTKITDAQQKITDAEKDFEEKVKALQEQFQELQKTKDQTVADVKEAGLGLMQAVQASRKTGSEEKKEEL